MAVPLLELFGMKGYQQLVGKSSHMMDQPITLHQPDHVVISASYHQTASLIIRYSFVVCLTQSKGHLVSSFCYIPYWVYEMWSQPLAVLDCVSCKQVYSVTVIVWGRGLRMRRLCGYLSIYCSGSNNLNHPIIQTPSLSRKND